jgi:hypothetical protein
MTYDEYVDLISLRQSIERIDFGDDPEAGDVTVLPKFTGGDATLYPDEFSGRHGETIESAALKINTGLSTLVPFITGFRGLLENSFNKQNLYYPIENNLISPTLSSGMPVYYNSTLSAYNPCTVDIINNDVDMLGVYLFHDNEHRIYTNGYITGLSGLDSNLMTLTAGTTYGLVSAGASQSLFEHVTGTYDPAVQLYPLTDSYSYIINDSIIPIYKAVSKAAAIIIPYRFIDEYSITYLPKNNKLAIGKIDVTTTTDQNRFNLFALAIGDIDVTITIDANELLQSASIVLGDVDVNITVDSSSILEASNNMVIGDVDASVSITGNLA